MKLKQVAAAATCMCVLVVMVSFFLPTRRTGLPAPVEVVYRECAKGETSAHGVTAIRSRMELSRLRLERENDMVVLELDQLMLDYALADNKKVTFDSEEARVARMEELNDLIVDVRRRHLSLQTQLYSYYRSERDLAALETAVAGGYEVMDNSTSPYFATIYVAIPTYRDDECAHTVDHLFTQAANPDRIFVGVAQFNDAEVDEDIDCAKYCLECKRRADQIRITRYPHTVAAGPATSRAESVKMRRGEDYHMQIDSHMIFKKDWDVLAIQMLNDVPSEKPFLTAYPPVYSVTEAGNARGGIARVTTTNSLQESNGIAYVCGANFHKTEPMIDTGRSMMIKHQPIPLPSAHYAGGFSFSKAEVVDEVPFDPFIKHLFGPDETLRALRVFTNGWDIYTPNLNLVAHHYYRKEKHKFWEVNPQWYATYLLSMQRAQFILGTKTRDELDPKALIDVEQYGIGPDRSVADWAAFAEIDFEKRTVGDHCNKWYDVRDSTWKELPVKL